MKRYYWQHLRKCALKILGNRWEYLQGTRARLGLTKIGRRIGQLVVDEQDAGFEQSLINRLYYALSDLILYLKNGDGRSVEYV